MINPRDYKDIAKLFAEFSAIAKGDLKAEYEKVAAAVAEFDKRNNFGEMQRSLAQKEADHSTAVAKFTAMKEATEKKLADWEALLKTRTTQVESREANISAQEKTFTVAKQAHAVYADTQKKALDDLYKAHEQKVADLAKMQENLHNKDVALGKREEKLNAVMGDINAKWQAKV
jgi:chromosome segregation ATPase